MLGKDVDLKLGEKLGRFFRGRWLSDMSLAALVESGKGGSTGSCMGVGKHPVINTG